MRPWPAAGSRSRSPPSPPAPPSTSPATASSCGCEAAARSPAAAAAAAAARARMLRGPACIAASACWWPMVAPASQGAGTAGCRRSAPDNVRASAQTHQQVGCKQASAQPCPSGRPPFSSLYNPTHSRDGPSSIWYMYIPPITFPQHALTVNHALRRCFCRRQQPSEVRGEGRRSWGPSSQVGAKRSQPTPPMLPPNHSAPSEVKLPACRVGAVFEPRSWRPPRRER